MKKNEVFAGLLVFMCIACVGSVAAAQDMVFTSSDVGEVAAPPPPPSGPPSEALANALRLYQQESYAQAAVQFQRIVQGETKDEAANVQKAQFFLGKCFYHLRYYQAALGVFEEIAMMSTGHLYFHTSLQWLAQLSRELPEPAGIIGLVGRYGGSISVLKEFNKPETKDLYNELLYLMGRHWYSQGEFAKARDFFLEIDRDSDLFIPAVFFVGITHVQQRKAAPAAKAFKSIVDKFKDTLFLGDEEERFLNLGRISLARIYYSTSHWASAVDSWNAIPQDSEHYLDALFEESWAYFQTDQLDRALGNIHTINSPYFDEEFYPESLILKSVIFFGQCLYDEANITINEFRTKYEPIQTELQKALTKFQDNETFFKFLRKLREVEDVSELEVEASTDGKKGKGPAKTVSLMGFTTEVIDVIRGALGDRTLLKNLEYVEILEDEESRLKKMPPMFINSTAGVRIQQDINTAKAVAIDNTGNLARSRYERTLSEIQNFLNEATRVEIEILKALRGEIERELATESEQVGPDSQSARISSDAEHVLWPYEGEFWRDELGYYKQPISNHCGR